LNRPLAFCCPHRRSYTAYRRKLCRDDGNGSTRVVVAVEGIANTDKFTIWFRGIERHNFKPGSTDVEFAPDYSFGFANEADAVRMAERIVDDHIYRGYRNCADMPDNEFPRW
jgi:hypothetical protein